jgi:phosphocarrier protein HPr
MLEKIIEIKNETGIHARPASLIVKLAQKYQSDIMLVKNGNEYNCKSIMSILRTGAIKGDQMMLKVSGEDSEEAFHSMTSLLEKNLDA